MRYTQRHGCAAKQDEIRRRCTQTGRGVRCGAESEGGGDSTPGTSRRCVWRDATRSVNLAATLPRTHITARDTGRPNSYTGHVTGTGCISSTLHRVLHRHQVHLQHTSPSATLECISIALHRASISSQTRGFLSLSVGTASIRTQASLIARRGVANDRAPRQPVIHTNILSSVFLLTFASFPLEQAQQIF